MSAGGTSKVVRGIVPIPLPEEGNPNYPLPRDYFNGSNTAEYCRKARINAARQWMIPCRDKALRARRRVESLRFFDLYYLWPDYELDWDPLFYDTQPRDTPAFHWTMIGATEVHQLNIFVAPRGSAKSYVQKKNMPHVMITHPGYSYVYASSTHTNAKNTGETVRAVCYDNMRVNDDFSDEDEFGGRVRPPRGMKPTGTEKFFLNNGSNIVLTSAESRQRGLRPRRYVLDDPEFDANGELSVNQLRENMSVLIGKVIMPMIMRKDCGCDWIGTFVSRRHLLWQAMSTYVNEHGVEVAEDPRFNFWNRIFIKAAYRDEETGEMKSCWPDMWPPTIADKENNPDLEGTVSLEEMEQMLTPTIFRAEMLGEPGTSDGSGFPALETKKHGYLFHNVDDKFELEPWNSDTIVKFYRASNDDPDVYEPIEMSLKMLWANSITIMSLDSAKTNNVTSDWKVATIGALLNGYNELFIFDIYGTKERMSKFVDKSFEMCDRWHNKIMAPENTSESTNMINEIANTIKTRAIKYLGVKYTPTLNPYKPGKVDKFARIERMTYRFEHGLIKLPMNRRFDPHWKELFQQIEDFVPGADNGGLKKDDHIDTVSMINSKLRGKDERGLIDPDTEDDKPDDNRIEIGTRLREGGSCMVGGVDLRKGADPRYFPKDVIAAFLQSNMEDRMASDERTELI